MKLTTTITTLAALAAPALAQSITDLPQCALSPALAALGSTGCQTTDIACACKNPTYIASLQPAIQSACSAADQAKAISVAQGLCAQAGVSLSLPSSAAAASTSAPASASASASAPASTSAAPTPTPISPPATSVVPTGPGPVVSSPPNGTSQGNSTMSSSPSPAAYTGGAAVMSGMGEMAFAGILVAGIGAVIGFY